MLLYTVTSALFNGMDNRFASLKLLDSDGDWKFTEQISYSKFPGSQQIDARRVYQSNGRFNLVKRHSCDESFSNGFGDTALKASDVLHAGGNRCDGGHRASESYSDSFLSSHWQFSRSTSVLQAPRFVPGRSSHEVNRDNGDSVQTVSGIKFPCYSVSTNSNHENTAGGLSCEESKKHERTDSGTKQINVKKRGSKEAYENVKKKFRPLIVHGRNIEKRRMNVCFCTCLTLCVIPALTLLFALLINPYSYTICDRRTLFLNASLELQQKVYGQKDAVSSIVYHLDQDFIHSKVLCLVGGTGVGKSYTTEIVMKNFPRQNDILLYDAASDDSIEKISLSPIDSHRLLVIENLKLKNLDLFADIMDLVSGTRECLTVLAIFNVEDVNDNLERRIDLEKSRDIIRNVMEKKRIDFLIVPYEPLTREAIEMCVARAAAASGLKPTLDQTNEIVESLLSSGSGCKRAYAKLQVASRP